MKKLLAFRFYRLYHNRLFWRMAILLPLVSVILSGFRTLTTVPIPCVWGEQIYLAHGLDENDMLLFLQLSRNLSATGYLFLIPSFLCAFLVYDDFLARNVTVIISRGYSLKCVRRVELLYMLLINCTLVLLVRFVEVLIDWNAYQFVAEWCGWKWLAATVAGHLFFSTGNVALLFVLTVLLPRKEIPLVFGFAAMALDTLYPGSGLIACLPTGGVASFFGNGSYVIYYFSETILLLFFSANIPVRKRRTN